MSNLFVPNEILRIFKQLYPQVNVADVSWTWEVPGKIYEAAFSLDKQSYEVEITVTGHHLLTEVVGKVAALPKAVTEAVNKRYPKYKIDSSAIVSFSNGDVYYELDILSPAREKESEILVREDGLFIMKGEDL